MYASAAYIVPLVVPVCSAIVGILIGAYLARNTAFEVMNRQEINRAFLALEASFVPVLRILGKPDGKEYGAIPSFFDAQEIAMLSFVWHLTGKNRQSFKSTWDKYKEWQSDYHELEAKSEHAGLVKFYGNNRDSLAELIEEILEAAKKY